MRSLVKSRPEFGIWMEETEPPKIGPNDLLIRIRKTAICGTDIHIYNWDAWAASTVPVPMVVGHEYAGEIVAMGSEVKGLKIGDRVSGEGHITCGHCRNCRAGRRHLCRNTLGVGVNRPGSFAEYLVLPAFNAFKLPDDIPDDVAAIFDPFGNAVHTALSFDLVGEDVLITGAGPIGCMAAAVASTRSRRLSRAIRFSITSESLVVANRAPSSSISRRTSSALTKLPLCAMPRMPLLVRVVSGCALKRRLEPVVL